jgi:Effector Associated Constant Component 1
MAILLSISATDLDDESLQKLTRELCQELRDEAGIESSLAEQPAAPGRKGDLATIGQILIAAVGAGGPIVALVNVLKAYVQRKPSLQFEFHTKDGDKVRITADDLRGEDMEKLLQAINHLIEGTK